MSQRRPGRLLGVALIWIVLVGGAAAAYKFLYVPREEKRDIAQTGSSKREGLETVGIALDAFSGYCVLRSQEFSESLVAEGLFPDISDDGANYGARIESLAQGSTPFAVFTIDALIKACAEFGKLPGTIVMVIDESRGADALLAYKSSVPSIDGLNSEKAKILVTADSPSDTLVRVVRNDFQLPRLREANIESLSGPEEILRRLRTDDPGGLVAYSLWEPFVSRALSVPQVIRLADSSMVRGTIVDVLVVQRDYLLEKPGVVEAVVKSYLQALYDIRGGAGLSAAVKADAEALKQPVSAKEANNVVKGIAWKGTADNYAHMGLLAGARRSDDLALMITRITHLLKRSGAIERDPTGGKPHQLFYDKVLAQLQQQNFHPGDRVTEAVKLRALSEAEQQQLVPLGRFQVDSISFARGSPRILELGQSTLEGLVETLDKWHRSYLVIVGHVAARGDADANRRLALERAENVKQFLVEAGVDADRLYTRTDSGVDGAYTVSFVASELPY